MESLNTYIKYEEQFIMSLLFNFPKHIKWVKTLSICVYFSIFGLSVPLRGNQCRGLAHEYYTYYFTINRKDPVHSALRLAAGGCHLLQECILGSRTVAHLSGKPTVESL